MPLILRKFQTFPMLQPDSTLLDVPYATVAFVDENGQQYSQVNVHADDVAGVSVNDALVLQNHDDIDWHQLAGSIFEYASEWENGKRTWDNDEVNQIIMIALQRPLTATRAEPHGLDVPSEHAEMIGVGGAEGAGITSNL